MELRSVREKKQQNAGREDDVYQYDFLPERFRNQVVHILRDALGSWQDPADWLGRPVQPLPNNLWQGIYDRFVREKGRLGLYDQGDPCYQCLQYTLSENTDDTLDIVEFTFRFIDGFVRERLDQHNRARWQLCHPDDAITELNRRFRENGVGYVFEGGQLNRIDSRFIHAEAVKPAIQLLHDGKDFAGPLDEFMQAHRHHRKGNTKDAITWALKALESTLKTICTLRSWHYDPKATAKDLLDVVYNKELIPAYLQSHFGGLRATLEGGVPTVRSKTSAHGQGPKPIDVPHHLAAFTLHQTAASIVFLIESHRAK